MYTCQMLPHKLFCNSSATHGSMLWCCQHCCTKDAGMQKVSFLCMCSMARMTTQHHTIGGSTGDIGDLAP